jgi:hypothetical protein
VINRYTLIQSDGRISATSNDFMPNSILQEYSDDFNFDHQGDYVIDGTSIIYNPVEEEINQLSQTEINSATIDYIAMMTGVKL